MLPPVRTRSPWLPYIALAILAVAAAAPLGSAWLPCTDDAPFHLYRAVELGSQLALGHLFPRWAPHMALGYGYPFFNFYAPLSSYGVVLLHVLGLAYPAALKLAFALGLWLAGLGAFWFVRDLPLRQAERAGDTAGLAAGAAYLFAPYLAYDILFRGNLAESFAFVWPPLVLWGLLRLARSAYSINGWAKISFVLRPAAFLAISYAALILTHNIFALIASPLFAGYATLLAWEARSWRVLARGLLMLAVGATLTAYFWVPALAERDLVHSDRLFVPPIFTWYTNFISPAELLAPPHAEDPLLINPSPARGIGLLPALLGLPALGAALMAISKKTLRVSQRPEQALRVSENLRASDASTPTLTHAHTHTLFFFLALLGYGLLTLPVSAPIWRLIPPLALVQFPWRMLGPAALCAAVLIGLSTAQVAVGLQGRGAARWLAATPLVAVVGLIYFGNLGWWYPRYCPSSLTASVADLVQFEIDSHTIGTTAKGEYIPRTAGGVPADLSLAQAILRGQEPSRLSLPADAAVTSAPVADPLDARYQIAVTQPVTATYQQFFYPGWQVMIDGHSVAAAPDANTGLIVFSLPAGTHAVRVMFGMTPLRSGAVAVSLMTLVGLIGLGLASYWRGRPTESLSRTGWLHKQPPARWDNGNPLPITRYQLLFFVLLPILKFGLIDRLPNPLRVSAFDSATQAPAMEARLGQTALVSDFAGGMRLLGYDLSRTQLAADGALDVALYMARTAPSERRYWPAFNVADEAGLAWQDPDYLPPRWQREPPGTPLWPLDQYAQWARHITLLPGTPPGRYQLYGSVFDLDSQQIASVLDPAGNAVGPRFTLGTLQVGRPSQPFALQPPQAAAHNFGALGLLGYDLDRTVANAGDTLRLSLFWRSQAVTSQDLAAEISLTGADGTSAYQVTIAPVSGLPTNQWQPGDEWRGQARVRLPANLPDGDYTLNVALAGTTGSAILGGVHISAPARSFVRPAVAVPSGAEFSGVSVLEGYTLTRSTAALTVNLVWRATATPEIGYSVFVHLQGADGRVWAQSDAAPANWTRPTTGWLPGEYISDAHGLNLPPDLPAGTYTLWTGLYDPANGARVPVTGPGAAPDQRAALGQIIIP